MTNHDITTKSLARIYFVTWVAMIVLLGVAAAATILSDPAVSRQPDGIAWAKGAVGLYLMLLPAGVMLFGVIMFIKRQVWCALMALAVALIWCGFKLIG